MPHKNDELASDPLSFYARRDADREAAYSFDQERIAEAESEQRIADGERRYAESILGDETPERAWAQCPTCGVFTWNGLASHICVEYHDRPCVTCGQPTTFVTIAAPGYGSGYSCPDGHYDGTQGEFSPEDVR